MRQDVVTFSRRHCSCRFSLDHALYRCRCAGRYLIARFLDGRLRLGDLALCDVVLVVRLPAAMSPRPAARSGKSRSRVVTISSTVSGLLPSCSAYLPFKWRSKSRARPAVIPRSRPRSTKYSDRLYGTSTRISRRSSKASKSPVRGLFASERTSRRAPAVSAGLCSGTGGR